jgi:hypothetical protein
MVIAGLAQQHSSYLGQHILHFQMTISAAHCLNMLYSSSKQVWDL